jgi:hypothetical protein
MRDAAGWCSLLGKFGLAKVSPMARPALWAKIPLIGMSMVFLAMFIVAVTAYLHVGWYSIVGYAAAAALGVSGFILTFRDVSNPPTQSTHPAEGSGE